MRGLCQQNWAEDPSLMLCQLRQVGGKEATFFLGAICDEPDTKFKHGILTNMS